MIPTIYSHHWLTNALGEFQQSILCSEAELPAAGHNSFTSQQKLQLNKGLLSQGSSHACLTPEAKVISEYRNSAQPVQLPHRSYAQI